MRNVKFSENDFKLNQFKTQLLTKTQYFSINNLILNCIVNTVLGQRILLAGVQTVLPPGHVVHS